MDMARVGVSVCQEEGGGLDRVGHVSLCRAGASGSAVPLNSWGTAWWPDTWQSPPAAPSTACGQPPRLSGSQTGPAAGAPPSPPAPPGCSTGVEWPRVWVGVGVSPKQRGREQTSKDLCQATPVPCACCPARPGGSRPPCVGRPCAARRRPRTRGRPGRPHSPALVRKHSLWSEGKRPNNRASAPGVAGLGTHQWPGEPVTQVFPEDDILHHRPVVCAPQRRCASAGASHAVQPEPGSPACRGRGNTAGRPHGACGGLSSAYCAALPQRVAPPPSDAAGHQPSGRAAVAQPGGGHATGHTTRAGGESRASS
jgi:hypothetical protein